MIKTKSNESGTDSIRPKRSKPEAVKATPEAKAKAKAKREAVKAAAKAKVAKAKAAATTAAKAKAKRDGAAMVTTKQLAKGKLADHALSLWRMLKAKGKLSTLSKGNEEQFLRVAFNIPKGLAPEDAQTKAATTLLPFVRKQTSRIASVAISSATAAINKGEREAKFGYFPSGDITQDGGLRLTKRSEIVRNNANKNDLLAILNADKDEAFAL